MSTSEIVPYSAIKVDGPDGEKFLQGQLTCDVTKVTEQPSFGAHCNRQGRVLSLFRVFQQNNAFYLLMPAEMIDTAMHALQKYAMFSKVTLKEEIPTQLPFSFSEQPHHDDVLNGIPRLYPATVGEFLPHYLNLVPLKAVSFKKGCYTGQEIIARMQHRGNIKQHLYPLKLDTAVTPGEKIKIDNKVIGTCVDYTIVDGQYITLAIMKDDVAEAFFTN